MISTILRGDYRLANDQPRPLRTVKTISPSSEVWTAHSPPGRLTKPSVYWVEWAARLLLTRDVQFLDAYFGPLKRKPVEDGSPEDFTFESESHRRARKLEVIHLAYIAFVDWELFWHGDFVLFATYIWDNGNVTRYSLFQKRNNPVCWTLYITKLAG